MTALMVIRMFMVPASDITCGPCEVLVHEGVDTQGKVAVMQRLESICNLQAALGASRMVVGTKETQLMKVMMWLYVYRLRHNSDHSQLNDHPNQTALLPK